MKRFISLFSLVLAALLLSACGGLDMKTRSEEFAMEEPEYTGLDEKGNPCFRLEWPKVKGCDWYEVYIYSQVDGSVYRDRLTPFDNNCSVTFLNFEGGYDTDTASYRVKVRPTYSGNDLWSAVWAIDFVDGDYTLSPDAEDFEPAAKTTQAQKPTEKTQPLEHSYPELLPVYLAREQGYENMDLSLVAALDVNVNHCEYGEPTQSITDMAIIEAAIDAVEGIFVTGKADSISSTGTYYAYSFCDADGQVIFSFAIQDGMLMKSDGRYSLNGLSGLLELDGIMLDDQWEEYWETRSSQLEEYEAGTRGDGIFELNGYNSYLLSTNMDKAKLLGVTVQGDEHRGKDNFVSDDEALMREMLDALAMSTVNDEVDSAVGQEWRVSFEYALPAELTTSTAVFRFVGDCLECDEGRFNVEGLDELLRCGSGDVLADLLENRSESVPVPIY